MLEYLKSVYTDKQRYHSRAYVIHSFLILFILFIVALEFNNIDDINVAEGIFMIYALGFTLEKVAAMQEHGIRGVSNYMHEVNLSHIADSLLQGNMGRCQVLNM